MNRSVFRKLATVAAGLLVAIAFTTTNVGCASKGGCAKPCAKPCDKPCDKKCPPGCTKPCCKKEEPKKP